VNSYLRWCGQSYRWANAVSWRFVSSGHSGHIETSRWGFGRRRASSRWSPKSDESRSSCLWSKHRFPKILKTPQQTRDTRWSAYKTRGAKKKQKNWGISRFIWPLGFDLPLSLIPKKKRVLFGTGFWIFSSDSYLANFIEIFSEVVRINNY
jgi:hypothetical protein